MGIKIREKKPGEWWIFVNYGGKRTSRKVGSDKGAAREAAKKIQARLTLGEFDVTPPKRPNERIPTYQEFATAYLEGEIKPIRKRATYERYREVFKRHIFPVLGKKPIDEVTKGDIRALLVNYYVKSKSKKAMTLIRDIMSGPFATAFEDGVISKNPISGALKRLNIKTNDRPSFDPLTGEETALFLKACQGHYRDHYPFFLTLFRTGVRVGECLALRWGDIDWHGRFIQVSRSYRRQEFGSTKTGKTRRVDMSNQLYETLKELYAKRKREALQSGTSELGEIVFHNGHGIPWGQNSVRYIFKRVLKKAGLREVRVHDLRHSFASQLLSDGVSPVYVKEQLGHHSIEITVNVYGHWIPSGNQEIVNRLDHLAERCTQSAPYTHPQKTEREQLFEITPAFISMVPKAGLEPARA